MTEVYGVTEKAAKFVRELTECGSVAEAERRAGVSKNYGYDLIRVPAVQAALHAEIRRNVSLGAAIGVRRAIWLCEHAKSESVQVKAALGLLDRAGFVAPRAAPLGSGVEKTLNEMNIDELKDLAAKLEDELAGRAKAVSAPPKQDAAPQAIDILA